MELTAFQQKITAILPKITLLYNEPMRNHTSFRIGGNAEVMAFPKTAEQLRDVLTACRALGVLPAVLGAGTNVLAPDEGLSGLVICLKDALTGMERTGENTLRVFAGVTMTKAANFAASLGLSGLEFAHGIPGTVGGGVYMNAGAYGGEICQVCTAVQVMGPDGKIRHYTNDEMAFSYRHSRLEGSGDIVLSAEFTLEQRPEADIRARMQELIGKRRASQPLELPSAGSAFKRPADGYAAALIDRAGLKGFTVGDAAVSEKHAGFVVNLGNATAEDVKALLQAVAACVKEKTGILLEPEIRIW